MSEKIDKINEYLKALEDYKLPKYTELPQIPLYMEQVVSYICDTLDPLFKDSNNSLTQFMINNYVKAKIIDAPSHKKYNNNHIGYLISISLLKNVVSLRNMAALIEMDKSYTSDKEKLYDRFKDINDEILKNQAHKIKSRIDSLNRFSRKGKKNNTKDEDLNLSYIALRLYIEANVSKLIADSIMEDVASDCLPAAALKYSKKEVKLEQKKMGTEASKVGGGRKK